MKGITITTGLIYNQNEKSMMITSPLVEHVFGCITEPSDSVAPFPSIDISIDSLERMHLYIGDVIKAAYLALGMEPDSDNFESDAEYYDTGYRDAIKAALDKAIEIGKRNGFENDGQSGIMCLVGYLYDIEKKFKRSI